MVKDCIEMENDMNLPWYTHLKDSLAEVNMTTELPWQDTDLLLTSSTDSRKLGAYSVQTTSKLDSFASYKTELTMSKYLSHIANPFHRTVFAKLRTTNHSLEIELGRHRNTPRTSRVCRICITGAVET